ncbi:OprO/OprP family phosphate-selective porin [Psychroserpens sp. SPM9]|uniref:OprO/OprP family phosphate-selective porin n=1 Tax=Psychroserpens sp. SPM9 TaxID=2975598 RepID=UPI0021A7A88B|nr:OprO/OprP family phosphate-selective porin [Psychroserpens sp. SPM9]MDG5490813.1 OprO/OprP family phosphate-selective porin [Psychroserpens sp. SPM9]
MKSKFILALLLCTVSYTNSQEISDTSFGKGLINFTAKDSSFSIKFAPRFQVRSNSSWNHDGEQYTSPEHNFTVRRARLKFDGFAYSPKLIYKIELGLSNRDIVGANQFNRNTPRYILDAVLMWNFYGNWELWAGQTKLPGNVERVVSSGNLQLINRSLLNSRFNIDRDLGIQLRHKTNLGGNFLMREKISISQGEGRNVTEGNEGGLQYTARLEFLPFGTFKSKGDYSQSDLKREPKPKLMVGFTYNYNQDAVRERGFAGDYMIRTDGSLYETDQTTLFADAMFKHKGFSFMGEYAKRTADDEIATEADGTTPTGNIVLTGNALNLQAGYLFKNNYEIAARFTTIDYESITQTLPLKQYTLGVNKFIVGHKLKLQSDISYTTENGNEDSITFRMGFDIHF